MLVEEPGLVPRRALEWHLSIFGCFISLYIFLFEQKYFPSFAIKLAHYVILPGWGWTFVLFIVSLYQLFALIWKNQALRRSSAIVVAIIWFLISLNLYEGGFRAIGCPLSWFFCGSEAYVFFVLRGARLWKKS